MVVWLADEDSVRGRIRQELTPLKQTLMGIQRIVTLALDGKNGASQFVLWIQWANVLWERLPDITLRPQHVIDGSGVAASQPVGERDRWRHRRFGLLLPQLVLELRRVAILHSLQVFAIENQFSRHFENFVRDLHHPHFGGSGPFFKLRANSVNRVAHENRFNEAQLVISVAKGVNVVMRHQPQAQAEYHSTRYQALPENYFFLGKDIIGHVGMHVENHRIEQHAFAFGNRAANRTCTLAHLEVLV